MLLNIIKFVIMDRKGECNVIVNMDVNEDECEL